MIAILTLKSAGCLEFSFEQQGSHHGYVDDGSCRSVSNT